MNDERLHRAVLGRDIDRLFDHLSVSLHARIGRRARAIKAATAARFK
jgi:hypothetical protein